MFRFFIIIIILISITKLRELYRNIQNQHSSSLCINESICEFSISTYRPQQNYTQVLQVKTAYETIEENVYEYDKHIESRRRNRETRRISAVKFL